MERTCCRLAREDSSGLILVVDFFVVDFVIYYHKDFKSVLVCSLRKSDDSFTGSANRSAPASVDKVPKHCCILKIGLSTRLTTSLGNDFTKPDFSFAPYNKLAVKRRRAIACEIRNSCCEILFQRGCLLILSAESDDRFHGRGLRITTPSVAKDPFDPPAMGSLSPLIFLSLLNAVNYGNSVLIHECNHKKIFSHSRQALPAPRSLFDLSFNQTNIVLS